MHGLEQRRTRLIGRGGGSVHGRMTGAVRAERYPRIPAFGNVTTVGPKLSALSCTPLIHLYPRRVQDFCERIGKLFLRGEGRRVRPPL